MVTVISRSIDESHWITSPQIVRCGLTLPRLGRGLLELPHHNGLMEWDVVMAIREFTDRNGDDWRVRPDGFLQRGGRILKLATVQNELGPLVPKPTHGAPDAGLPVVPFDESVRRAQAHSAAELTDRDKLSRVRRLAFEIERDPHAIPVQYVAEAIRKALGEL